MTNKARLYWPCDVCGKEYLVEKNYWFCSSECEQNQLQGPIKEGVKISRIEGMNLTDKDLEMI